MVYIIRNLKFNVVGETSRVPFIHDSEERTSNGRGGGRSGRLAIILVASFCVYVCWLCTEIDYRDKSVMTASLEFQLASAIYSWA